jgi:hypothetical protein
MDAQRVQKNDAIMQMLETHPNESWLAHDKLAQLIQQLNECASTCTACADACLGEKMAAELAHCIRLNLDCADICQTTARVVTRIGAPESVVIQTLLQTCIAICEACGQECASHAQMHAHCHVCAETCLRCENACRMVLGSF